MTRKEAEAALAAAKDAGEELRRRNRQSEIAALDAVRAAQEALDDVGATEAWGRCPEDIRAVLRSGAVPIRRTPAYSACVSRGLVYSDPDLRVRWTDLSRRIQRLLAEGRLS